MPKQVYASYCDFAMQADHDSVHKHYHDHQYGFPLTDDNALFGRLVLEINQAGLSWDIILKKQAHFFIAYDQFDVATVAAYTDKKRSALLQDAGIIRNRLKVDAAIANAKKILALQKEYGSFHNWILQQHPKSKEEWVKIFKKEFKFTGGEIVNEFLMSTGWLPGAHTADCPVQQKVLKAKPMWLKKKK